MIKGKLYDLSQLIFSDKEEYKFNIKTFMVDEFFPQYQRPPGQWYAITEVNFWSHVGTHLEAPLHYIENGMDVAEIPIDQLIGEAIILDFTGKKVGEPISLEDIKNSGKIRKGDMVILKTGCDKFYRTPRAHDRPYLSSDATRWLAHDRKIKVLGTDASGFEVPGIADQPNHRILFEKGIPVIEHLTNLSKLPKDRVTLFVLPFKARGLDSCPVRVVALVDE